MLELLMRLSKQVRVAAAWIEGGDRQGVPADHLDV
jgi:hypothetical protein